MLKRHLYAGLTSALGIMGAIIALVLFGWKIGLVVFAVMQIVAIAMVVNNIRKFMRDPAGELGKSLGVANNLFDEMFRGMEPKPKP